MIKSALYIFFYHRLPNRHCAGGRGRGGSAGCTADKGIMVAGLQGLRERLLRFFHQSWLSKELLGYTRFFFLFKLIEKDGGRGGDGEMMDGSLWNLLISATNSSIDLANTW